MTPSEYIRAEAEEIEKRAGKALGRLTLALVRRQLSVHTMEIVATAMKEASDKASSLLAYVRRIQEERHGAQANSTAKAGSPDTRASDR